MACGIPVPWPGVRPVLPAMKAQSLNHWTTREVPEGLIFTSETQLLEASLHLPLWLVLLKSMGSSSYHRRKEDLWEISAFSPAEILSSPFQRLFCAKCFSDTISANLHNTATTVPILSIRKQIQGLPRWCSGEESACQCRRWKRRGFDPWVGKIPWKRKWQPTPVFLPGESHALRSLADYSHRVVKSWTWVSNWVHTHKQRFKGHINCPWSISL